MVHIDGFYGSQEPFAGLSLETFDYELPRDLIAQRPLPERSASRLMVVVRGVGLRATGVFAEIGSWLRAGDLLVMNDTRVFPARLFGSKDSGGRVEVLLIRPLGQAGRWEVMARSSKPLRPGQRLTFPGGLTAEVGAGGTETIRHLRFSPADAVVSVAEIHGRIPLPPYIRRDADPVDRERYQTVFSRESGSVAAPTAGLHFTEAVLADLKQRGVELGYLTLHVGPGTFLPVRAERLQEHQMHRELYTIPEETAAAIRQARRDGRRVIAVGTTTTRALEAAFGVHDEVVAGGGETDLFIRPGFRFRVVQGLVTNFHLPRSTLLMLVSAFAGLEPTLSAYHRAVAERFRFFSYGDCMLVV